MSIAGSGFRYTELALLAVAFSIPGCRDQLKTLIGDPVAKRTSGFLITASTPGRP
jgi:hypothetical protein